MPPSIRSSERHHIPINPFFCRCNGRGKESGQADDRLFLPGTIKGCPPQARADRQQIHRHVYPSGSALLSVAMRLQRRNSRRDTTNGRLQAAILSPGGSDRPESRSPGSSPRRRGMWPNSISLLHSYKDRLAGQDAPPGFKFSRNRVFIMILWLTGDRSRVRVQSQGMSCSFPYRYMHFHLFFGVGLPLFECRCSIRTPMRRPGKM